VKISELAKATQVPAKTIRYYEEIALLPPAKRDSNGYRHYSSTDAETLIFIRRCRELNIAIDDIKQLVEVQQNPEASCTMVDNIIGAQLKNVRKAQQELAILEQSLRQLASSCEHQQVQECTILHKLRNT